MSTQDNLIAAIASELARVDGYDPDDQHGGLYDLRWSGGPTPEPEGDAWSMDYLPTAKRIAKAIANHASDAAGGEGGWHLVPTVPTEAMLCRFWTTCSGADWLPGSMHLTKRQLRRATSAYLHMLSAAPSPQETKG